MTIACNTLNPETFLELISSKGRESFYEEFGFEQRPAMGMARECLRW